MDSAAIFEEAVVVPRRGFPAYPGLVVIERPGWLQILTPAIRTGGLNEVIHAELPPDEADAAIAAAIAMYRERGLRFRWTVGPGSAPADLGERLARAGLAPSWGRAMALTLQDPPGASRGAVSVAEVDVAGAEGFARTMAAGWGMEPGPLVALYADGLADPAATERCFLATLDGAPVGTASYRAYPRSAYLMGGVVLPAARRRGVYRALVAARMADAWTRGIRLATSYAREATSAPILERLGFATIARYATYSLAE